MEKDCYAKGGGVGSGIGGRAGMWVSGNPDVKKEAEGDEPYAEGNQRKRGGKVKKKKEMHAEGAKAKHRMDRPKRARGGKVGSDRNPFSSAHNGAEHAVEPKVQDDRGMRVSRTKDERDNSKGNQN
jgi:hypothetical protein